MFNKELETKNKGQCLIKEQKRRLICRPRWRTTQRSKSKLPFQAQNKWPSTLPNLKSPSKTKVMHHLATTTTKAVGEMSHEGREVGDLEARAVPIPDHLADRLAIAVAISAAAEAEVPKVEETVETVQDKRSARETKSSLQCT